MTQEGAMGDPEVRAFGDALHEAREAKGRSVREVAATTRIQIHYIEALEAENWPGVPGGVIGRGFVRVLAKELGGPSAEWVAAYRQARGEADGEPVHTLPESDWKVDLRRDRHLGPVWVAAFVLVGCVVGIWVWSPWSIRESPANLSARGETSSPKGPSAPAAMPVRPDGAPVTATRSVPAEKPELRVEASPPPAVEPSPPKPGARLTIRAVERTWIRVVADGGTPTSRVLGPGEQASFSAQQGFRVKFGNAGGVRLTWNGEALEVPGKSGQVTEIELPAGLATLRP